MTRPDIRAAIRLQEHGHVLLRGALPRAFVARFEIATAQCFADFERRLVDDGDIDRRHVDNYLGRGSLNLSRLMEAGCPVDLLVLAIRRSRIATLLRAFFGDDVFITRDASVARFYHPGNRFESALPFHQDIAAGNIRNSVTCWIPLRDCGTMAPGLELVDRPIREALPKSDHPRFPFALKDPPDGPTVRPIFQRGDVVLFLNTTPHRSHVTSDMTEGRHSFDFRFMPARSIEAADDPMGLIDAAPAGWRRLVHSLLGAGQTKKLVNLLPGLSERIGDRQQPRLVTREEGRPRP